MGLCFYTGKNKRTRIIYKFLEHFKGNNDYMRKLVNLIQINENKYLDTIPVANTYYTLLNKKGEVVLVDKYDFNQYNYS